MAIKENLKSYKDGNKNYLNIKEGINGGLEFNVRDDKNGRSVSMNLSKVDTIDLSKYLSNRYKKEA